MTSIWVLSEGSYSDYSVVGVMPDQETAERVAEQLPYHQAEEIPILDDVEVVDFYRLTFQCDENGENHSENEQSYKVLRWGSKPIRVSYNFQPAFRTPESKHYRPPYGYLVIEGYDIERMRKVYSEKKARIIADEVYRRMPDGN